MVMLILLQARWAYFLTQKSPVNDIQSIVKHHKCALQKIQSEERDLQSMSMYGFVILIWLKVHWHPHSVQLRKCLSKPRFFPHFPHLTPSGLCQCRTKCQAFHVGVNAKQMFAFYQQSYQCPSDTKTLTTGCIHCVKVTIKKQPTTFL